MSSAYCSLDDAFNGPVMPGKKKKTTKVKESFVPGPLSGTPSADSVPEPMGPPPASGSGHPEAGVALQEFFPIPGETAEPDEWAKAFMLEPSQIPQSVDGKPTLWRTPSAPVPVESKSQLQMGPVEHPTDIHKRLDTLARQLDSLTSSNPMQSTAELFLFIAIGLLFLLAIDTLLRCATSVATSVVKRGGARHGLKRVWRS